ncbi:quinone reductase [Aspergillus floccosus]
MKAIIFDPNPPDSHPHLHLETVPLPTPAADSIRIRVHAFGLNRADLSHSVARTSRIPGSEAVGIVDALGSAELERAIPRGSVVATAGGGMGRSFDGAYAEYTCVPARQVHILRRGHPHDQKRGADVDEIRWELLGALPELLPTAWGAVIRGLALRAGERVLVRGGTTTVGLAATAIATTHGAFVSKQMRRRGVDGFDKVLELVGARTLRDSLRCARKGGTVCLAGTVGGEEEEGELEKVNVMELIPSETRLTVYSGSEEEFMRTPLAEMVRMVEDGRLKIRVGRVLRMEEVVQTLTWMEDEVIGKMVALP